MSQNYSKSEISLHTTKNDCWLVIHGKVYDVTAFLKDHPGGDDVLLRESATGDATESFEEVGHSSTATSMMQSYLIGHVSTDDLPVSVERKTETLETEPLLVKQQSSSSGFSGFILPLLVFGLAFGAWCYLKFNSAKA